MKKKFLLLILLVPILWSVNAQNVISLCDGDSAFLVLTNYTGELQWEQSPDNITFTPIIGASDDSLFIAAGTNMYFRARVDVPNERCYSYVSYFVPETTPFSHTGYDLDINGTVVNLTADNNEQNAGIWTIIDGFGGIVYEPNNPESQFEGICDSTYMLVWTIANGCGTAKDTVNVTFNNLVINNCVVVIDSINHLISDDNEINNGIYKIIFVNEIPAIPESAIIVGNEGKGYLRRVTNYIETENTVTFQTVQASLDDAINSGAVWFLADNNDMDSSLNKNFHTQNKINYLADGVSINEGTKSEDGFQYSFNDVELYDGEGLSLSISGSVNFNPNFVFDLNYGLLSGLKKFYFYADNATLVNNINVHLSTSQAINLSDVEKTLASYSKTIYFQVGILPVAVVINTDLIAKFTSGIDAVINYQYGLTNANTLSLGLKYENDQWATVCNTSFNNTLTPVTMNGAVNFQQRLEIVPRVSVELYGVAGPWVEPMIYEQANCSVTPSLDWNASLTAGLNTSAGADVTIVGNTLLNYDFQVPFNFSEEWNAPSTIEKVSGDNQTGNPGDQLSSPLVVRVLDNWGNPCPLVNVYYNVTAGNGNVNPTESITSGSGTTQTNWTIGEIGTNSVNAIIKNGSGGVINSVIFLANNECPEITVTSTKVDNTDCINPNGQISISASGSGGFQYSLNGEPYQESNVFNDLDEGVYSIQVIDSSDCVMDGDAVEILGPGTVNINSVTTQDATSVCPPNGSITIDASDDGPGSLEYTIDGGDSYQAESIFDELEKGHYFVGVRNAITLCEDNYGEVILDGPEPLTITGAFCNDSCDTNEGNISVGVSGGVPPYDISGDGGGHSCGTFTITVTDDCGTTRTTQVTCTADKSSGCNNKMEIEKKEE